MRTNGIKILISMFIAGAVALQPMTNYAQDGSGITGNPQDDAAFTCASAINVMDCIKQTQDPASQAQQVAVDNLKTAIPISNQTFGFTGPISFNVRYDQDLSWILDAGYVQKFGNRAAAALKVSAGPNEYRGNSTIGLLITPKQQIKLTYEFLTQNLPFDYASGKVNQWVNQNAYGAAYRYMLGNSVLQAVELSASYTKAHSKELSDAYIYGSGGQITDINERRIAGGQQAIGMASVVLTPFKNTIIKIGGGYSQSRFDTKWDSDQATSAIAYNVEASRLLTPKTMLSTGVTSSATERAHTLKLSRILPGNIEGNVTGQYSFSNVQGISNYGSVTAGLSYPAPKTYTNMFSGGIGDLKSWVSQPVIYNTRVLAIAEERLLSTSITGTPFPLQVVKAGLALTQVATNDYFKFSPDTFDRIDYNISSLVNKNDPNTKYQPDFLSLEVDPTDSFNAVVKSGPVSATAMQPGQYTMTLSAQGYRKGSLVGTGSSNMDINVTGNSDLPAPSWKPGATLTPATAGSPYSETDLLPLLTDNSKLPPPGDQYQFILADNNNSWLTLDSPTGHKLVGNKTPAPTNIANVTIYIKATSTVSQNVAKGDGPAPSYTDFKTFILPISSTGTVPTWQDGDNTTALTPAASYTNAYGPKDLSDYVADYGTSSKSAVYCPDTNDCTKNTGSTWNLPITGLYVDKNTGVISGTPTDSAQVSSSPIPFQVVITNTAGKQASHQFTLLVNPSGKGTPSWNSAQSAYQTAYVGNPYSTDLNQYFKGVEDSDTLTYTLKKPSTDPCSWLTLSADSSILTNLQGQTPDKEVTDCGITVTATSRLSGNSTTIDGKVLAVLPAAPTIQPADFTPQYNSNANINLADNTHPTPTATNTYTYEPADGTTVSLPSGLSLSKNGVISGTPTEVSDVDKKYTVSLKVTSSDTNLKVNPSAIITVTVAPNGGMDSKPAVPTNLPTGTPAVAYKEINGTDVNLNAYVKYTLTNGKNDIFYNYTLIPSSDPSACNWNSTFAVSAQSQDGIISGIPDKAGTCSFSFNATSKATGNKVEIDKVNIVTAEPVIWTSKALWDGTNPLYMSGNGLADLIIDKQYVYTNPGNNDVAAITIKTDSADPNDKTNPPTPATNATALNATIISPTTLRVSTTNIDAVNNCNDASKSTLTLQAVVNSTYKISKAFTACLQPNSKLTAPTKAGAELKNADWGMAYGPVNINPNDTNTANATEARQYINPTKTEDGSTPVNDVLSMSLTGTSVQDNGAMVCNWLKLTQTDTGYTLSGNNNGIYPDDCNFNILILSKAMGNTASNYITIPMTIKMNGGIPTMKKDFPASTSIRFDDSTTSINLKDYIDIGTSLSDPNLKVEVSDTSTCPYPGKSASCNELKSWTFTPPDGEGNMILKRYDDGAYVNGGDAGQLDTLIFNVTNSFTKAAGQGPFVSQPLKVTVTKTNSIVYAFKGDAGNNSPPNTILVQQKSNTTKGQQSYFNLNPNNIVTFTTDTKRYIQNNTITMASSGGCSGSMAYFFPTGDYNNALISDNTGSDMGNCGGYVNNSGGDAYFLTIRYNISNTSDVNYLHLYIQQLSSPAQLTVPFMQELISSQTQKWPGAQGSELVCLSDPNNNTKCTGT